MRLLVVGGKLQGTEAVYLAAKAGYETVLVDRRLGPPAAGLADRVVVADVTADEAATRALVGACDAVLPACEDEPTLRWLAERVPGWGVPLLFDLDAYHVSESKIASQRLFTSLDVPRPVPWPDCGYPAVAKPSSASGSEGVVLVRDETELAAARQRLEGAGHAVVVEEYVAGPSLSVEVVAWGRHAVPAQVTGLEFDAGYDCKRVVAPVGEAALPGSCAPDGSCDWAAAVAPGTLAALDDAALRLAHGLGLNGIMDVEVMGRDGVPRVLEIDARLPSQTPTAVFWSSGVNLVAELVEASRRGSPVAVARAPHSACVYQHVWAHDGVLEVAGEHVMGSAAPLALVPGFCGADEALTDYRPGSRAWAATLIAAGDTVADARARTTAAAAEAARLERLQMLPERGILVAEEGLRP